MAHICPPSAAVFTQTKWREIVRTKSYKMAADTYTEIAFSFSPASGMMNVQLAFLVNGRVLEIHNGTGSLSKNGKMMLVKFFDGRCYYHLLTDMLMPHYFILHNYPENLFYIFFNVEKPHIDRTFLMSYFKNIAVNPMRLQWSKHDRD